MSAPAPFADTLSRFMFDRAAVHGAVVSIDDACAEILHQHPYPPALRRTLVELLAASALLASTLKFRGTLAVQMQGAGPVRLLVVECDASLNLRATAQWREDAERLPAAAPLSALAGDPATSRLAITLDPRDGSTPTQGIVALEAASIAAMIEHYLTASEQIASRLALAADGARVRGILLQRLPGASPEDDATWQRASGALASLERATLLAAPAAEGLISAGFPADDIRVFAPRPVRFRCGCSPERVGNALRMLGRSEIESILAEQGAVGVTCEFCGRGYRFAPAEARALFAPRAAGAGVPSGAVRH